MSHISSHFFLLKNKWSSLKKWTHAAGLTKKKRKFLEKIILKLENISINAFCPNKQFDGGVFDWVSENFISLEEKLELIFFVLEL